MIGSSYFLHRDHITNIYHKYILQAITPVFYGIICDMKTRSGINIRKWCLAHEELIETRLAGETDADELADLGEGGLCLGCTECRYPVCPFGK